MDAIAPAMFGLVTGMVCRIQHIGSLLGFLLFPELHNANAGCYLKAPLLPLKLPTFDCSPELFSNARGNIQRAVRQDDPELITAKTRERITVPQG
jgi:hypothetical protein